MKVPKFNAEASLYKTTNSYRSGSIHSPAVRQSTARDIGVVLPAWCSVDSAQKIATAIGSAKKSALTRSSRNAGDPVRAISAHRFCESRETPFIDLAHRDRQHRLNSVQLVSHKL